MTADVHFGLPTKLKDIVWAMNTIRTYASEHQIDTVFVLGDLFHDREHINTEAFNAAYKFLDEAKELNQEWVIYSGNHDMFLRNSWDITAIKPLSKVATIVDEVKPIERLGHRFWIIPFIHQEAAYMKVLAAVEKKYKKGDVLLTHVGINNAKLNECYLLKNWSSVNFEKSKFDRVFAGHFHCHQHVSPNVWYPGSPIPYRFDEGMVPHGFIEYDVESREVKFINIFELKNDTCPADYVTVVDDMLDGTVNFAGDHIRVQLTRDYTQDELLRLRSTIQDGGAMSVKFQKLKDAKIDLTADNVDQPKLSSKSPGELFEKWLDHHKPKNLDHKYLQELNLALIKNIGSVD